MFGLVVLAVAALYLGLMLVVVRFAWRLGRAHGGTRRKAFGFASLGFLLVYLPVFWDHIPTLVVHRYYCAKDAGFTAYVDAKEWHAKNAEAVAAVKRLSPNAWMSSGPTKPGADGFSNSIGPGGLIRYDSRSAPVDVPVLTVQRIESRISDARTGQLLAWAVDYAYTWPKVLRGGSTVGGCVWQPASGFEQQKPTQQPFELFGRYQAALFGEES